MTLRTQLSKMLFLCGAGLSVQLMASGFEIKPIGKVLQMTQARASEARAADGGEEKILSLVQSAAAFDQRAERCEAAKRQAFDQAAPVLSALAVWSLDNDVQLECREPQQDQLMAVDDVLPVVELAEYSSVASVMAADYGAVVFDKLVSNDRLALSSAPAGKLNEALLEAKSQPGQNLFGQQMAALDTDTLDEIRGGFELDGMGLKFSFGIERAVFINGELIASTTLNLRDLQVAAGVGGAPGALPSGSAGALGIVQNGAGNSVATTIAPNNFGTVIQNSLDNQKIQNVTTINASVNSMQAVRAMSVQSAIQSGIVSSLRR